MANIEKITDIAGKVAGATGGNLDADFIGRINGTITNFKGLMKMINEARGMLPNQEPTPPALDSPPPNSPPPGKNRSPGLTEYIDMAIKAGYGDKSIGEIMEKAAPLTLKQIRGFMRNVGL